MNRYLHMFQRNDRFNNNLKVPQSCDKDLDWMIFFESLLTPFEAIIYGYFVLLYDTVKFNQILKFIHHLQAFMSIQLFN